MQDLQQPGHTGLAMADRLFHAKKKAVLMTAFFVLAPRLHVTGAALKLR